MKLGSNDISSVYLGTNGVSKVYLGSTEIWSSYAYLLDDYSGAAAAYSLRQLRSAYTGSAIRVRRSSDNTEQDIGFSNNELDTTSLASFCSGTDGYVTTWYDQSGNGNDATQTTAANQPQIVSSGSVITENGKPAVQFDGNNDSISTPTLISGTTARTIFTTVKATTVNSAIYQLTKLNSGASGSSWRSIIESSEIRIRVEGSAGFAYAGGYNSTSYSNFSLLWTSGGVQNVQMWQNSNTMAYTSGTSSDINTRNEGGTIGEYAGSDFFDGIMQELIFYPSDQSSNRTGIETNINDFYSIY